MVTFAPKLDILPPAQRALWDELGATPPEFTLYGGTAIALQLGHRQSVDFDFFGRARFDPLTLYRSIPYLRDGRIVQSADSTLTVTLEREGRVLVSFFATPRLGQIAAPIRAESVGLSVASLLDLAALKCVVVQSRAEAKDFIDLEALIQSGITLPRALAAAAIVQGASFNPYVTLKALSYFDDGDLATLDPALRERIMTAVRDVSFPLPRVEAYVRRYDEGAGA